MKLVLALFAALTLGASGTQAQTPAAAPKTVTTTPTKAGATTTKSQTTMKGAPVPHSAASIACSTQADAQGLHGKARQKMRSACKAAAKKG